MRGSINMPLSPSGKRAAFEARGEIFTVPAGEGRLAEPDAHPGRPSGRRPGRPMGSRSPGSATQAASTGWSSRRRTGQPRASITLPTRPSTTRRPWSPDSKRILFTDTHRLWVAGRRDRQTHPRRHRSVHGAGPDHQPSLEPGLALDRLHQADASQFHSIFVYDIQSGQVHQVTDGMADATWPAWDASGKYLFFLASTNFGLTPGGSTCRATSAR